MILSLSKDFVPRIQLFNILIKLKVTYREENTTNIIFEGLFYFIGLALDQKTIQLNSCCHHLSYSPICFHS
jgi:hypothetical protein